ncbi:MAG: 3-phosphoshikimate 1-carboxyvinyltransferase [bacterium]|nr:3-phosphoshikimate 1-carboxyvinyltransferase [bacterium]
MTKNLRGDIRVGGDKSISHRAIMLAALAKGKSLLNNLSRGDDVNATLALYQKLGMIAATDNGSVECVSAGFEALRTDEAILYCGNSGTTLRLSLGILAGLKVDCRLAGDDSLNRRPVRRVIEPLRQMGGDLATAAADDRPPVTVRGRRLHGINISTSVASAQAKSAILFAGLHAEGVTSVTEPEQSRNHTEIMLKHLGCNIDVEGRTSILSPVKRIDGFAYTVPGDISTAVFFIVAALAMPGSELIIRDVLLNETRTGALEILRGMGASIEQENLRSQHGEPVGDLVVKSTSLRGFDAANITTARYIDEVPALAVAAMFAEGKSSFHNIGELRVKESDRATAIVDVVKAFGGSAELTGDTLHIQGGLGAHKGNAAHLGDHRIAMMIEIINLINTGNVSGEYGDTISVSAPEFYELMKTLES